MLETSAINDENERKVAVFLERIGFSFVDSRSQFKKSDAEPAREIDLLFTFEDCLFIIEVSTLKSGRNSKILTFMQKWNAPKNLERLWQKYPATPHRVMRVFFDLSKDTPENKSQDVEELAELPGNMVVYRDVFEEWHSSGNIEQVLAVLGSSKPQNF